MYYFTSLLCHMDCLKKLEYRIFVSKKSYPVFWVSTFWVWLLPVPIVEEIKIKQNYFWSLLPYCILRIVNLQTASIKNFCWAVSYYRNKGKKISLFINFRVTTKNKVLKLCWINILCYDYAGMNLFVNLENVTVYILLILFVEIGFLF